MKFDLKSEFKRNMADQHYDKLKKEKAYIDIKKITLKRKLDQNGLYWLWLTCIEQETGFVKDELHIMYRALFLRRDDKHVLKIMKPEVWNRVKELIMEFHYIKEFSEIIDLIAESTANQPIDKFAWYLTQIKDHARAKFDVILLNMEEKQFIEFYKEYHRFQ